MHVVMVNTNIYCEVLKMLAVMEASQSAPGPSNSQVPVTTPEENATNEKEFLSSGRTGRRNALPDILAANFITENGKEEIECDKKSETEKCPDDLKEEENKSKNTSKTIVSTDSSDIPEVIINISSDVKRKQP